MANYNKVILVGNLTRDPQLKYLPSQMAVVEFGLAVNHKYKTKSGEDREEVLFIDVAAFGRGAEVINQYCQKGRAIAVDGRLEWREWEDKDGNKRQAIDVIADSVQFLGGREEGQGGGNGFTPQSDVPVNNSDFQPVAAPAGASTAADDDIPF